MNIQQMMKQAQQMQEEMGKKMKETVVEASAGGSLPDSVSRFSRRRSISSSLAD